MKSALVIAPAFFGYEVSICEALEERGFEVQYIDERVSNSTVSKALLRVRPSVTRKLTDRHFSKVLRSLSNRQVSHVLVIKGESVPRWFMLELRERYADARFVFYAYDSLSNSSQCLNILDIFDVRYSFDRNDVRQRGDFDYLPLFYAKEFAPPNGADVDRRICFLGTLHSGRWNLASRLLTSPRDYRFFYVPARWYFFVVKYVTREFANVSWRSVSFRSKSRSEIADLFRSSQFVLDVPRTNQIGLTMRTFETLASGAILITTNRSVESEKFFDESRIVVIPEVISRDECDALNSRLDAMERPTGMPDGFEDYSVSAWSGKVVGAEST